jgi:uncharacterized protein (DUF1697 family)
VRTHVALLRGINVGGHNRVAMADLRDVVEGLGHTDVATYIQSGNVVFTAQGADTSRLAANLERAIAERLGVRPGVVVLSREELAGVVDDNPFPEEKDPKCLHAILRQADLTQEERSALSVAAARAREKGGRDEAEVVGRTLFLRTPDGLGRSVLAEQLNRAGAKTGAGTARNWATVTKLLALLDG